jgi:hypothetical protein
MKWPRAIRVFLAVTCFVVLCALTLLAEVLVAVTLLWSVVVTVWVAGSALLLVSRPSGRAGKRWAANAVILLVALITLRFVALNPAKPFWAF